MRLWQRDLCESLGLRGRILISKDGINGTLGGDLPALKRYVRKTRDYPPFKDIDFKWSEGTGLDEAGAQPRLSAAGRQGARRDRQLRCSRRAAASTTTASSAAARSWPRAELHALVAERGDDVVFFDGRNAFEAEIGRFKNAVVPDVATTRDFVAELDSGKYDHLKDKPVVTYCTGGIRCEVLAG